MALLEIEHLNYQYSTDSRILFHDFNLHINSWDFVVITGSSGSGKTTLTKMILGQITNYQGTITFQDRSIRSLSKHEIQTMRRQIACVFQDYKLVSYQSIQDNITLPLRIQNISPEHIKQSYDKVCEVLWCTRDPRQHINQLSGWEKQKIAIARSLITQPRLFIADEPTGNLDAKNSRLIADLIIKVHQQQIPVVLITHDVMLTEYIAQSTMINHVRLDSFHW